MGTIYKLFEPIVGVSQALEVALEQQLKVCEKEGLWKFWKGCILGIGGFIYFFGAGLLAGIKGFNSFLKQTWGKIKGSKAGQAIDDAKRLGVNENDLNKSLGEHAARGIEELDKLGYDIKTNPKLYEIMAETIAGRVGVAEAREKSKSEPDAEKQLADLATCTENEEKCRAEEKSVRDKLSQKEREHLQEAEEKANIPKWPEI